MPVEELITAGEIADLDGLTFETFTRATRFYPSKSVHYSVNERRRIIIIIMNKEDYTYGSDFSENDEFTTDKMGNTISKKELNRKTAEEELRKAAKARRAAKLVDKGVSEETPDAEEESVDRPKWLQDYDKVKAKLANGKKLSGKDKKLLKRGQAREVEDAELGITYGEDEEETPLDKRLQGFSLSIPGGQTDSNDDQGRDVVIKGISISAPEKPLIVNADLTLSRGRRYGLIGANGRGKSTLLRFLAARRLPVPSTMDILLVEQEVAASKRTVLEDVLAADKQRSTLLKEEKHLFDVIEKSNDGDDMTSTANRLTVVADELDAIGADGAEARARAILSGLGFTEAMVDNSSSKLSGGWRMRVSLARALFAAPKLLLLDEPTNHLDLDAVLWLDTYLTEQFPKTSTVLTVSHDRDFLDEVCTDLILLTDDGGLEYHRGGLQRLDEGVASRNAKRAKDYALQQKMLKQEKVKHPSLKIEKLTSSLLTSLNISRLAEKPREYKVHFDFVAPDDARTGAGLSVDLRDICFSYDSENKNKNNDDNDNNHHEGAFRGFKDLNLCVDATKRAAIVGANGSGKSTLLKLLTGDITPTSGEVNVGRNLKIGYYDQHFSELKKCPRNSSAVDYLLGESLLTSAQEARKWLGKFGLDSARHVIPVKDLSGGQKARVCFASIALRKPHLLILDEPTNHLDLESADALVDGINAYGGGVLAVSHDASLVHALSRDANDDVEMPLYVCKDSTVVIERGGFAKYRRDLAAAADTRERKATADAKRRAARKANERREKLSKIISKHKE